MQTRFGRAAAAALVMVGGFAIVMPSADAHHPEVTATAVCAADVVSVSIVSSSWQTDEAARRYSADVAVALDGIVVGRGQFVPSNGYAFTVVVSMVPDGRTHTVRATAVAPFGPAGEFGDAGAYREAAVVVPTGCPAASVTTVPVVTTTEAPRIASTTVTVAAVTTTVPVAVGGVTESRPEAGAATPLEVLPRFAG